jgi:dTDP-glucose 4,6-dehydratase
MNLKGKKTLVTGAGGFIGGHLTEALIRQGANVRAFVRYNSRGDLGQVEGLPKDIQQEVEISLGDLKDPEAVRRSVKDCEVIFHLGSLIAIPFSYTNPTDFVQTNVVGTTNLLNACLHSKLEKMVHTSTSEVYGTALYTPIDEKHPLQAQSPYSATKIGADKLAESYYRAFDLPVTIARPFNVYGPRQSARAVIPTIVLQTLNQNKLMLGSLHPTRDFTYVEDTVNGLMEVAKSSSSIGEAINIGCGQEISIGDLAKMILAIMGKEAEILKEEQRVRPRKSEVDRLICDNSKARELLDWEPRTSLEEGLTSTINWCRDHVEEYRTTYAI